MFDRRAIAPDHRDQRKITLPPPIHTSIREMYQKAPHGRQVTKIHLFGVKYADVITRNNYSIKEIVSASGINISYATEVNKGINLSEYVVPKE